MTDAVLLPSREVAPSDTALPWTERALSVVSTASLALGGAILMLMVLATPGQPLDHLFRAGSCGLGM